MTRFAHVFTLIHSQETYMYSQGYMLHVPDSFTHIHALCVCFTFAITWKHLVGLPPPLPLMHGPCLLRAHDACTIHAIVFIQIHDAHTHRLKQPLSLISSLTSGAHTRGTRRRVDAACYQRFIRMILLLLHCLHIFALISHPFLSILHQFISLHLPSKIPSMRQQS